MNAQNYLIRRTAGRCDATTEQIITLAPEHWAAKLLRLVLPASGVRYTVPLGRLKSRVSFDGKPLSVCIRETGETVVLSPKLQALGLANFQDRGSQCGSDWEKAEAREAATTLCANLHPYYDEQVARLRARINDAFIDLVGLTCEGALIDGITEHTGGHAQAILSRVRTEVGVEIEWLLEADPEIQAWIQKLQAELRHRVTQSFNEKSSDNQFNLTYTCKIVAALPSRHHVTLRRARSKTDVKTEISNVLNSAHTVLDPALGNFAGNVKVWLYPNFDRLLRLAFEKRVCDRIAEDFGYKVVFEDFKRERTASEVDAIELLEGRERRKTEYLAYENQVSQVRGRLMKAREEADYNEEAESVKRVKNTLVQVTSELHGAREELEKASRGRGLEQISTDNPEALRALIRFHDQLNLGRPDLLALEDAKQSRPTSP